MAAVVPLLLPHRHHHGWHAHSREGPVRSALPYHHSVPTWLELMSDNMRAQIYKLAKKGLTPSQIGMILRDSQGVAHDFVTWQSWKNIANSRQLGSESVDVPLSGVYISTRTQ